jgi:flagellar assembly protein FliH
MGNTEKFLFDTAFDKPEKGGNAKPLPTHTEEEVQRVREEAFHAGHEAALVEAKKIEERQIKELFGVIAGRIDDLSTARKTDTTLIAQQATQVAVAICRKVLPEMARRNALNEIEAMVEDCIASIPEEPRIVVRVADAMVDSLQARTVEFAGGFDGKLVLLGDDQMPITDCAVVWADGGTERNLDRLWQDIDSAIDRLLANNPVAETEPEDDATTPVATPDDIDTNNEDTLAAVVEEPNPPAATATAFQ